MPEITEETLQAWAQLADYTDSHGSLDARVALDAAIAEIRRLRGEVAALVEAAQVVLKFRHQNDSTPEWAILHATLANLPASAKAHDKRLKAEGAAEAYARVVKEVRRQMFLKDVNEPRRNGWNCALGAVAKTFGAEAARLREEAGR